MPEEQIARMTVAGWVFLAVSWAVITSVVVFCISIVLRSNRKTEPGEIPPE